MKKRLLIMLALAAVLLLPLGSYTENEDAEILARVIYATAGTESYEAKLAVGSVVMNRVDDCFFPNSVDGVAYEQHAFAVGDRYDEESLRAARQVLAGERTIPSDALWYRVDGGEWGGNAPCRVVDGIGFYTENGWDY